MKIQDPTICLPLRVQTIHHYKLLGDITTACIRKKLRDPKNGFTRIRSGGSDNCAHYTYFLSDIIRYWKKKCYHPDPESMIDSLIKKYST